MAASGAARVDDPRLRRKLPRKRPIRLGDRDRSLVFEGFLLVDEAGAVVAAVALAAATFVVFAPVPPVELVPLALAVVAAAPPAAAAAALNSAGLGDRDCRPSFQDAKRLAIKCDVAARPSLFSRRSCFGPPGWLFGGEDEEVFAVPVLPLVLELPPPVMPP